MVLSSHGFDYYIAKVWPGDTRTIQERNNKPPKPIEEKRFIDIDEMLTWLQDKKDAKISIHGEKCLLDWG